MIIKRKDAENLKIENEEFGIGFIKSRRSVDKVMEMAKDMLRRADSLSIPILEIIVDDGGSCDVDRDKVTKLCVWMEKDYVKTIIVRSIKDITNDRDDLEQFLIKARDLNVVVFVMDIDISIRYEPDNGAGC